MAFLTRSPCFTYLCNLTKFRALTGETETQMIQNTTAKMEEYRAVYGNSWMSESMKQELEWDGKPCRVKIV